MLWTLIVILLVATAVSAFLGEGVETIVIGVIVLFAVGLGFIQEFRAERAIADLRTEVATLALDAAGRVVRETMSSDRQRRLVEEYLAESTAGGPAARGTGAQGPAAGEPGPSGPVSGGHVA